MNKPAEPEFDCYADKYTELHRASISASGEDPAFFSAYKAIYMSRRTRPRASLPSSTILDFGCGIGNSIPYLNTAYPDAKLFGTDPSGESIRIARENLSHRATFDTMGKSRLVYPDDSFDAVLVACVLHHIPPKERLNWMRELRRVVKPDGQIFFFEHNILNPLTVKAVKNCPFDKDAILLPKGELVGLARSAEFTRVSTRYVVFFPHALAALRSLESLMGWIPFGAQYVVEASP
jgi:ubiquinone/menaquinone biosynthesis C-methylase UbiE